MRHCPLCGSETNVLETRDESKTHTRRRRVCKGTACGHRFTTAEFLLENPRRYAQSDLVIVRRGELETLAEIASHLLRLPAITTAEPTSTEEHSE